LRLDRYLVSLVALRSAGALLAACAIYASIDLVEATSLSEVPAADVLAAYPLRIPSVAAQVLPVALVLGVLLSVASSRGRGEWDALLSAGLSPGRLGAGLLAVPLAGAALAAALSHVLAPVALARYGELTSVGSSGPRGGASSWAADGRSLRRVDPGGALILERDGEGRAVSVRLDGGREGRTQEWRRSGGWVSDQARGGAEPRYAPPGGAPERPDMLAGAALTTCRLEALAARLESEGASAADLRAQSALRTALAAACFLAPLLGLGLTLRGAESRPTRLAALGLAVSAAYWLGIAVAWNGAVAGAWSPKWVSLGVAGVFAVCGAAACAVRGGAATPR